jgi:hypothetical protein
VLLTVWLWLAAPPPEIREPTVAWHAPAPCPSAEQVSRRFELLRGDARLTSSFEFVVIAHARRGKYELRIAGTDERYEADDCEALAEAALLFVSLALTTEPETTTQTAPISEAERAREAEDVAPFLRAAGVRRIAAPEPISFDVPVRLTAEVGLAAIVPPRPAAEVFVGVGPRGTGWAVDIGLIGRPSFAAPSPEPSVGARMMTWGGLVRACVGGRVRRFALAGCAGVDVSAVSARATGPVTGARARWQPWTLVELGPELTLPVSGRVAVLLRLSGTWLAARPNFIIEGAGLVCCANPIGISARVGVEFGLGRRRKPR